MSRRAHEADDRYFQMHGLNAQAPRALNTALQQAMAIIYLRNLRPVNYDPSCQTVRRARPDTGSLAE